MSKTKKAKRNPHMGGTFDNFLREEGIYEAVQMTAMKRVKLTGLRMYEQAPCSNDRRMSSSRSLTVSITTGRARNRGSALISASISKPVFLGMLISDKTMPGMGVAA